MDTTQCMIHSSREDIQYNHTTNHHMYCCLKVTGSLVGWLYDYIVYRPRLSDLYVGKITRYS